MVSKAPASWKQKRAASPPAAAGLKKRRTLATTALLLATLFTALFVYWRSTDRDQETLLLIAGKSPQENQFALPPVRYVEQTWQELQSELNAPRVRLVRSSSQGANFDETGFNQSIVEAIERLQHDDALIVWVNGSGITQSGKPVIVGDEFRIQEFHKSPKSLIQISSVLESMAQWSGPKLLVLDWGQEVFDPRIDLLCNNFVSSLDQCVREQPARRGIAPVWVLVSHMQGQISLVDAKARQSLFGRAVLEGLLVKPRRLPTDVDQASHPAAVAGGSKHLMLSNLVEYVVRRVHADSQDFQTPWLLKSGKGLLPYAGQNWEGADRTKLMALNHRTGNPLGRNEPKNAAGGADKKNEKTEQAKSDPTAKPSDATQPTTGDTSASAVDLASQSKELKELHALWQQVDAWRTPRPELFGWSESALAPLAYKDLIAQVLDLDLRVFSGLERSEDRIAEFRNLIERNKRQPVAESNTIEGEVDASARDRFLQSYGQLQQDRQWACGYLDMLKLLAAMETIDTPSLRFSRENVDRIKSLLSNKQWQPAQTLLESELNRVVGVVRSCLQPKADINRGQATAAAEILLRSSVLNAPMRLSLRDFQTQLNLQASANNLRPERSLEPPALLTISEPSWNVRRTDLTPDLLAHRGKSGWKNAPIDLIAEVDPRDLHNTSELEPPLDRVRAGAESPEYPTRPSVLTFWQIAWDLEGAAAPSPGESIHLEGMTTLGLVLNTNDPQLPFPKLQLDVHNVEIVIDGKLHDPTAPLDRSLFKEQRGVYRLTFGVRKQDGLPSGETSAALKISSSSPRIRRLPEELVFDLPVNDPVQLFWSQRIAINGVPDWKKVPAASRFTMAPFAGRESRFQFSIENKDTRAHEVKLHLFVLRDDRGRAFAHVDQEPDLVGRKPDFTWSEKINKQGKAIAKLAAPSEPAQAAPNAGAAANPPATPPAEPGTASGLSVAGGMILHMIVDDKPAKIYRINLKPRSIYELIEANVQMEQGTDLKVRARWRDVNGDQKADESPDDLAKQPMIITWDPLPWQRSNENIMAGSIPLASNNAVWGEFTSPGLAFDNIDQEVWLDIDGTPRSLIYLVRRDSQSPVSRPIDKPRPRPLWRRYTSAEGGKPGLSYVPYSPPKSEKDLFELVKGSAAVFPNLKGTVEVQLAVDLPDPNARFSVHLVQVAKLRDARARQIQTDLKCVEDQLVIKWIEKDQVVLFDFSKDQLARDQTFPITVFSADQTLGNLPPIVADLDAPQAAAPLLLTEVRPAGSPDPIEIRFKANDASGRVFVKSITAQAEGQAPKLMIAEPIEIAPNETIDRKLDIAQLMPGTYRLRMIFSDPFDHATRPIEFAKSLRINAVAPVDPANPGAALVKGDLKVKAKLPGGRRIRNPVKFTVEPPPEMEQPMGDDGILYKDLKAGSYKVKATYSEASAKYSGEKTIVIAKEADFTKPWEIDLAKKE